MKPFHRKAIIAALFLLSALVGWPRPAEAQKQLTDAELIASLKKGEHVIYVRHGPTDVSTTDQNREDLSDWTKQRNLSEKGRKDAATIGLAFRAIGIPVGNVISSPYCRCIETSKLAFGKVQVSKNLAFSVGEDKDDAERMAKSLRAMLGTKPTGQTNTILVSHSGNLQEAANLFPKPEGVAVIFKPQGNGGFEFVQRVEPQQWLRLADKAGASIDAGKLNAPLPERAMLCRNNDTPTK
jgi:phosphohistidine phosphatase SixA